MRRSLLDRLLALESPGAVPGFAPPPRPLAEGLWSFDRKLRMSSRIALPTRMTVARLSGGGLWVHSPVLLDEPTRAALDALGAVAHLVAPNPFHFLFLEPYSQAYPAAGLHLAPGLRERRPELPPARTLGDHPPAAWAGEIDQAVLDGRFREVVFLHRASRTLILTDLAFHVLSADGRAQEWFFRLNGAWRRLAPSRIARLTVLRDRAAVRALLRRVLDWDFDRVVVAHGDVLESGGRAAIREAFAKYLR